ncbi:MAG: hypothetical protein QM711_08965 [Micropruina sp.]|uniref:sensor histidine kinase n=1 Tax=Micropruina sp. TaxID=2737536 RepID=UPI0039E6B51F
MPAERRTDRTPRLGNAAVRRHAAGVLIAMLLVALAVTWQGHRRATELAEVAAVENVRAAALGLALPLTAENLAGSDSWQHHLLTSAEPLISSGEVLVVHIWRRIDAGTGEILWSTDPGRRGAVVPLGGAATALDSWTPAIDKLDDGTQSEGPPLPNLYEIYLPFRDSAGTPYVLEVYKPVREFDAIYRGLLTDWLPIPIAGILLLSLVTFPLSLRLARTAAGAERDRALFANRALQARAEEHRRISEVLHERTVQDLSAARLILDSARQSGDPAVVGAALDQASDLLAADVAELRGLLSSGEASEWQADDLRDALAAWIATLPERQRLAVTLPEHPLPLARTETAVAFRVIKEGLRNAVKHAGDAPIELRVELVGDELQIEVADGGIGFAEPAEPGLGLRIIRYAAASVGGRVSLDSRPGVGTMLRVQLPYPASPAS